MDTQQEALGEISSRLAFTRKLQAATNKIHATKDIDEIMLEVSQDICALFEADRLTIYTVNEERNAIVSKVKLGLNAFKDLRLPISAQSIAGYVAVNQRVVNIADVYDEAELHAFSPQIRFLKEVDEKTGYRTKQMLVAPVIDTADGGLQGVIQIINALSGAPFPKVAEEGGAELAKTLAIAMKQRQQPLHLVKSKFDGLVADGVISVSELELATRAARKKGLLLETVLTEEFQVPLEALGKAYAAFFQAPYVRFQADRIKPMELLANLKRDYVENSQWLPLEDTQDGLAILTPDPESVAGSRIVDNVFPKSKLVYKVCTHQEFAKTVDLFYGPAGDTTTIGDLLSGLEEEVLDESEEAADMAAAQDNELVKLVNKIIVDGYNRQVSDIHIEPYPGKAKTQIRYRIDGSLTPYIEVPASYRAPLVTRLKIMCDMDISEKRKPQDGKIKFKKFGPLDIELRVATLPTAGGVEDVVMRILAAG
ncbi:MAG TPA: secretion system protein E, partial [Betaproteobacteria bacterium]|nr:secretion system protein E [Betaproteobacteria bacterium]